MKRPIFILSILSLILLGGCSQPKNYTISESHALDEQKRHAYFDQHEFEWTLITPDQIPLYVYEAGKGQTIVAIHGGFGMNHDYMRTFLKPYEENFHMVYYDQRGSTRSPVPTDKLEKYITMENMVNDLELLRRELREEKLTLIAHSMGAILSYEYMRKYPERVGEVIIISGFIPRFPVTKAELNDMFLSQKEREAFGNRPAVKQELIKLKTSIDTTSSAYKYLNWKIQYASCQTYLIENWQKVEGGLGLFNPHMNEIIGPESHIPLTYMWKYYWTQRAFEKRELHVETSEEEEAKSPINYLPEIEKHPFKISYILGRYEFGDWNLRLYDRFLSNMENVDMHIFEKSCHNVWMDQPVEFHQTLQNCLSFSQSEDIDE